MLAYLTKQNNRNLALSVDTERILPCQLKIEALKRIV